MDSSDYRIQTEQSKNQKKDQTQQQTQSFIPHYIKRSDTSTETKLFDSHCHLGFTKDPEKIAKDALAQNVGALCCTVTPQEFLTLEPIFHDHSNINLALGLHPWWSTQATAELNLFLEILAHVSFIGEVGLDFSPRFEKFDEAQLSSLQAIFQACAQMGEKTISLHCVRAYEEMLGLLHATGVTDTCQCIFHWFSGSSSQLQSAIKLGCSFSVGKKMLQTKRGREYIKAIPKDQLLIETDMPDADSRDPEFRPVDFKAKDWIEQLQETKDALRTLGKNS